MYETKVDPKGISKLDKQVSHIFMSPNTVSTNANHVAHNCDLLDEFLVEEEHKPRWFCFVF